MKSWFEYLMNERILENPLSNILWFCFWILFGIIFKAILSKTINRLAYGFIRKYTSGVSLERFYGLLNKPLGFLLLIIIFYIGFDYLHFPRVWRLANVNHFGLRMVLDRSYYLLLSISIIWVMFRLTDFFGLILAEKASRTESKQDDQLVVFSTEILKITILIFGSVIILGSVFKLNVTSLVAGLGIGGLAVALAAKESLENILCSFIIFFDKPFIVGDMVRVGHVEGTVEKVGFRSTRIRTVEKSFLTIPNRKMIDSELDNLSLKTFRRVRFNLGLTYSTKSHQVKAIVADIQQLLEETPEIALEGKPRFNKIGSFALEVRVEYFVTTIDWNTYLRVQEDINFAILEIVEKHKGKLAFPTQTVELSQSN
ncbi:MAG: mechanosensitive ion channel family protein [Bacteroidia bacterium]|nr:mechanosensitive ion channel family protein [Bacteroidia bacterium]